MLTTINYRSVILLLLCSVVTPLLADFDERYRLSIGYSNSDFDSKLKINSQDDSIDKEIDFEDVLGFENNLKLGWLRGVWRVAERHRLAVTYMPIKRTSLLITQNDFKIADSTIKSGASVNTEANTQTFDIEYIYSIFKRSDLEIGITGGLYWMNSQVRISAAGEVIIDGDDKPEFRSDYKASQRLIAPLPLIGVEVAYEIKPQWQVRGSARYLDLTIGDINGRILSLNLGTEYFFNNHLGVGALIKTFEISVQQNGVVFINSLEFNYADLQAYLVFKY